ncbi:YihY/virulence factor BrkB family protein [Agromyces sp. ISL-38]|uniref:YihY/virulence factor BrkB family protein n=1 Tax=Agromyces sp. ISL-38 TaxID=2819107 RepID=UPI001BE61A81|nr:YihY/virulence factor BrkB family protein [Agromyces sp. ISL-38]MBT2498251.1 YihY/virulence factor BrkB family protein [Agromyces sp. ISL-38]MBT2519333.1 YihY/virulence factor BrkB family protein [Streptomyces sp. ISL-90]
MAEADADGASRRLADAPAPDDERKPESPREITKRSWVYVLRKSFREFADDECPDRAASLTYFGVLALFPGLLAIASLLALLGQGEKAMDELFGIVERFAPGEALDVIREPLEDFSASPAAGWAFVTGLVLGIWSASGYVRAFSKAMNRIYEIDEGRPLWKLIPLQLLVTILAIVLIVVIATILVVSGPIADAIGSALGIGESVQVVWEIVKWPVLAFAVIFGIAVLYYATPNAKQPKFRWISIGAAIAIFLVVLASAAFALYVANFSSYDRTYGSLAGVIIFLLWLWLANVALLFGAEFDAELERGRQLQAGIEAEESIQLPPRDTRKSDKAAKKEQQDVELGRRIRLEHADDGADSDEAGADDTEVADRPQR